MKAIFIFLLVCFMNLYSQNNKGNTPIVSPNATISKFHSIDELNTMGKGELIILYKERFKVLTYLLPYSALTTKPGATLKDLGIPENGENKSLIEKENKAAADLEKAVNISLENFIAYADKNNIIWSILFYEEMIRKLMIGKEY
jgi:hypothetical protein